MNKIWFLRFMGWGMALFLFGVLTGCTGNVEEEATVQAVVEQVLSTNTPTAVPTETASPTPPPTSTSPPTSVPPTDTPVPPTPTATAQPQILLEVNDEVGDAVVCDTQAMSEDLEVDIASIQASVQEENLLMRVLMGTPLQNDFSFAVLVALASEQDIAAYVWEVHDTAFRIGEINYQTGELVAEAGSNLSIEHDLNLGELRFTVPYSATTTISDTTTISQTIGISQLFVSSFHTPQQGDVKNCDTIGPLPLPGVSKPSP